MLAISRSVPAEGSRKPIVSTRPRRRAFRPINTLADGFWVAHGLELGVVGAAGFGATPGIGGPPFTPAEGHEYWTLSES